MRYSLNRACSLLKFVFSDKTMNKIMCGMAFGVTAIWMIYSMFQLAGLNADTATAYAPHLTQLTLAVIALVAVIVLGLSSRAFNFSIGPAKGSVDKPHDQPSEPDAD
ncbi:hypothetical protein D3C72_481010 [compost metagenome]